MARCSECGLLFVPEHPPDARYHRIVHDKAVNGPKTKICDGFHFITHQSLIGIQRLAQETASAALCETGYDITSFYGVKKKFDEHNTLAVVCVRDGRVTGLLVSRERECKYKVELDSFRQEDGRNSWRPTSADEVETHRRRAVDMIWVLKSKRRQGVAQGLIHALAENCGLRIEDIAHMTPFREDALRLWQGLGLSTIFAV